MATMKIRWLDTNILTNIMKTLAMGNLDFTIQKVLNTKLIITNIVQKEINIFIKKINNNNGVEDNYKNDINRMWKEITDIIEIKDIEMGVDMAKNLGEISIIKAFQLSNKENQRIVSNDRKDVIKYMKQNGIERKFLITAYEFYEEYLNIWFDKKRSNLIKFCILSNCDFKINHKEYIGNIFKNVL